MDSDRINSHGFIFNFIYDTIRYSFKVKVFGTKFFEIALLHPAQKGFFKYFRDYAVC